MIKLVNALSLYQKHGFSHLYKMKIGLEFWYGHTTDDMVIKTEMICLDSKFNFFDVGYWIYVQYIL